MLTLFLFFFLLSFPIFFKHPHLGHVFRTLFITCQSITPLPRTTAFCGPSQWVNHHLIMFASFSMNLFYFTYKFLNLLNKIVYVYTWWFDIHIHSEVITILSPLTCCLFSHSYFCVCVWWEHVKSTLSEFPVFNTVLLTIVIMLYIWSLDLLILLNSNFVHFDKYFPYLPTLANYRSTLCFHVFDSF